MPGDSSSHSVLFTLKSQTLEIIPPTQAALKQHIKRNRPYSHCQSLKPSLVFLNRASYGRRRNNDVTSQEREVTMMLRHNLRTDAYICGKSASQASLFVRHGRGVNRVHCCQANFWNQALVLAPKIPEPSDWGSVGQMKRLGGSLFELSSLEHNNISYLLSFAFLPSSHVLFLQCLHYVDT